MALSDNYILGWELANVNDSHSGGHHLTNNNGVTFVAGKIGNCANFVAASSQYLSIADNAAFSFGNATFSWSF